MTSPPGWPAEHSAEQFSIDPTDEEVEAWATRERQRRDQWSKGPTPEQAALWASRERDWRIGELERSSNAGNSAAVPSQLMLEAVRNAKLAALGALSLLFKASVRKTFSHLVQAGQDWEDDLMEPARAQGPEPQRRGR